MNEQALLAEMCRKLEGVWLQERTGKAGEQDRKDAETCERLVAQGLARRHAPTKWDPRSRYTATPAGHRADARNAQGMGVGRGARRSQVADKRGDEDKQ